METSPTEMSLRISEYQKKHDALPDAMYVGDVELIALKTLSQYYPESIVMAKRPKMMGIPVYKVDSKSHFELLKR